MSDEDAKVSMATETAALLAELGKRLPDFTLASRRVEADIGRVFAAAGAEPRRSLPEILAARVSELGVVTLMAIDRVFSPAGGSWLMQLSTKSPEVEEAIRLSQALASAAALNLLVMEIGRALARAEQRRQATHGLVTVGG